MANPKMVHTELIDFLERNTANANSVHSKQVRFITDGLGKNEKGCGSMDMRHGYYISVRTDG
jgi:hypothetical protein